jgi:hypothetical protein
MKYAEKSTIKSSTSLRCMVSRWKQPIKTSNADAHLIWSESDDKHQINSLSRTTFLLRLHREYTPEIVLHNFAPVTQSEQKTMRALTSL